MDMDSTPTAPGSKEGVMWQLVIALDQMRDAFTEVSLVLQDMQFILDEEARASAQAEMRNLLQAFKTN